ncbi:MAG: ABC transporter permease [Vicinamibacterales bacterium]
MTDFRLAARTLLKTPFVTSVAILSLALGIGANSAIFSLFNQVLLRPLPIPAPGELVNLSAPGPKPGSQSCGQAGPCDAVFSYPMFRDLERLQTVFTGIVAHNAISVNLAYEGRTRSGGATLVSGGYFSVLGLQPALGRLFTPDDDRTSGGHFVVVLAHPYWRTSFDASPDVIGRALVVNGHAMTILGVAPEGFSGTVLGAEPEVFVPLSMRELMVPNWKVLDNRRSYWAYLFARLKPDTTLEHAQSGINVLYRGIINDVEAPLQRGMSDQTMARFRSKQILVEPGGRGQSSMHREARLPVLLLLAVTSVVLLIACANIANLLLARAANRGSEMAVRLSIGASRRQLIVQLLSESCLLALLGGAAGLLVAYWTLQGIAALLPSDAAGTFVFTLDRSVLAFAAALSLLTGFLFGLFPALHSTRPDLVSTLKGTTGQPSGSKSAARFRTGLVTAQIALSMALLVSAGLFTRSLMNAARVDLGLKIDKLAVFSVAPALNGYKPAETRALFERIEDELSALPGVESVAASMVGLLAGSSWGSDVRVQGFQSGPDVDSNARYNEIGPGYFHALGIPLLAGREFSRADGIGAPGVAIVNQAFAKKFNLGSDVVGKRMGRGQGTELNHEIVGLVRDAKYNNVKSDTPPMFVVPYRQNEQLGFSSFYMRTTLDEEQLLSAIPGVIRRLDPNLPVVDLKTMTVQVQENLFLERMISTLSAAFAVLATLLAAVGLYGVLAYTVSQRTKEFGLRMALGADAARVRRLVLGQVGRMTIAGGIAGLAAALVLARFARTLLFELEAHDPGVLVAATVVLALVAMGAGFIPAWRASRLDPMRALRYE